MTAAVPWDDVVELQLPGLSCQAGGLAWQALGPLGGAGRRPVIGPDGRQLRGIDLHVSLDGERIRDCSAVVLGADGHTGVVQRWAIDKWKGEGWPPRRYSQRGQVRLELGRK